MKKGRVRRYAEIALHIAWDRLAGGRHPYFVWLMPTSRCNLRCRYCFGDFSNRPIAELPLKTWERIISGLQRLGTRHISLTGGEPMMRKDICRLINQIHGYGIECLLNSNGLRVVERIDELAALDMMSISLDGPPEINDRYRGEGSYDLALSAIRAAREKGIEVQILMTLTEDMKKAFGHVLSLAETYDCFIGMNILRPRRSTDGSEAMSIKAYTDSARAFLDYLICNRPRRLPYPVWLLRRFRDWPYSYERCYLAQGESLGGIKPLPCIAGRFMITIDSSGNLFSCARHCYGEELGNCADGDIEGAWTRLKQVPCQACLDFGWTLLNGIVSFRPTFVLGLFNSLFRTS